MGTRTTVLPVPGAYGLPGALGGGVRTFFVGTMAAGCGERGERRTSGRREESRREYEAGRSWAAGRGAEASPRGDLFALIGEGEFAELPAAPDARTVLGNLARGVVSYFLEDFQFAGTTLGVELGDTTNGGEMPE